jgi:hypothetical protein
MVHQSDAEAGEAAGRGAGWRAEMASAADEAKGDSAIAAPAESFGQSRAARRALLFGRKVDPCGGCVVSANLRFIHQVEPAAIW